MSNDLHTLRVRRVVDETADAKTFELEIPDGSAEAFRYEPGQFVTLVLPWEGFEIRRCYSFCTAPTVDSVPAITVKRVPDGRASNWLLDHVTEGTELRVEPPAGRFLLVPNAGAAPLVLFAGGSGITPVLSLAKHALHETERPVKLVYANRDAASVILAREVGALQDRFGARFHVVHHRDDASGFYTAELAERAADRLVHGDFYVCGPAPFMDTVEAGLREAGVRVDRLFFERFNSPVDADRREEEPETATSAEGLPERFVVHFEGKRHEVPYLAGESLLSCGKRAGLGLPSSCRDGFCGVCMAHARTGSVTMAHTEALTDGDLARDRILMCQARPAGPGPLEIDYEDTAFTAGAEGGELGTPVSLGRLVAVITLCTLLAVLVRALH